MKEKTYTQVHLDEDAYACRLYITKVRMHIHALSRKEKHIHVGKLTFGPWYLVLGNSTYGFGPWYLVKSVDPKYWVHGIVLLWFWTMVL